VPRIAWKRADPLTQAWPGGESRPHRNCLSRHESLLRVAWCGRTFRTCLVSICRRSASRLSIGGNDDIFIPGYGDVPIDVQAMTGSVGVLDESIRRTTCWDGKRIRHAIARRHTALRRRDGWITSRSRTCYDPSGRRETTGMVLVVSGPLILNRSVASSASARSVKAHRGKVNAKMKAVLSPS